MDSSKIDESALIQDLNDIVVLWNNNKSLENSYYGELLGNSQDFNLPLNNKKKKKQFVTAQNN